MRNRTAEDGSDLGMWLGRLFTILDEEEDKENDRFGRGSGAFPYVNGGLYRKPSPILPDTTWARD